MKKSKWKKEVNNLEGHIFPPFNYPTEGDIALLPEVTYFLEDTTGYPFTWTITQKTELSGRKNKDGLWESKVSEYELKGKPESGSISKRFATVGKAKKWVAKFQRKNPAVEIEYAKINNEIIRLRLRERRILKFLSLVDSSSQWNKDKEIELRNVRNRMKTLTKKFNQGKINAC